MSTKRRNIIRTLPEIKALCIEDGPCWIWTGAVNGTGYPQIWHDGKLHYARRLARMLADRSTLTRAVRVTSKCRNPRCISPECSYVSSPGQINKAAWEDGRNISARLRLYRRGIQSSTVSDDQVFEIRQLTLENPASLAAVCRRLGISHSHGRRIHSGTVNPGPTSRLTPEQIAEIKAAERGRNTATVKAYAEQHGISLSTAYRIRGGKTRALAGTTGTNPFAGLLMASR